MPAPRPIPPELRTGPFRLADAHRLGVDADMIRGRRFRRLYRGVHVWDGLPDRKELRADAARLAVVLPSVLSHLTAADLRGLPVPTDGRVHLTVPPRNRRPSVRGIAIHQAQLARDELTTFRTRPMTSATRTFVDLARRLSLVDLVILGDAMVRKGFASPDRLREAASRSRSPGRRVARVAASLVRSRVDSPMETQVRLLAVLAGLPCPETGVEILDEYGQWVATVDMAYVEAKIVIEYDGDLHRSSRRKWRHDAYIRRRLRQLGWEVIVLTADDVVERPRETVRHVHDALAAREHGDVDYAFDPRWEDAFGTRRDVGRCA